MDRDEFVRNDRGEIVGNRPYPAPFPITPASINYGQTMTAPPIAGQQERQRSFDLNSQPTGWSEEYRLEKNRQNALFQTEAEAKYDRENPPIQEKSIYDMLKSYIPEMIKR